jgi:glycosyltransferase involved in cell wall biosynthesis
MDMSSDLAVLIPCFDAGDRLRPVVEAALKQVHHVIVVNDGCGDDSVDSVRDLPIEIVDFPENRGKGFALIEGFQAALTLPDVEAVCVIDADGQHDPSELPRFFQAFEEKSADLVVGVRVFDQQDVPWRSRFGNKITITLASLLLGQRVADTQSGYRLHSKRFAQAVIDEVEGGRYETEMDILVKAVREEFCLAEVPIATIYETGNASSHFNKGRDSILIYRRLFQAVFRAKRARRPS